MSERSSGTSDRPRGWQVALRGFAGHPLHPPFTDATIGMFVLASGLAVIGSAGAIKEPAGKAMWLALIGGPIAAVPAATTGLVDWLFVEWGTARWRTATAHMTAMVGAVVQFALAAWQQHPGYVHGRVSTAGLVLSLAGLVVLTIGVGSAAAWFSYMGCVCWERRRTTRQVRVRKRAKKRRLGSDAQHEMA